jgi:putative ABC transport system permease protein
MTTFVRVLHLLALRPLRRHPLRALLAIVAVAAGASMAASVFIVRSSLDQSVETFGRDLAGPTDLRVVGATRRGGLEPGVVDAVAGTPGVGVAVPVVQAVTTVQAPLTTSSRGRDFVPFDEHVVVVLGVDCRAEQLVGSFGCTADRVADHGDRPLAVGPNVGQGTLQASASEVDLAGAPVLDALGQLGGARVVVFPLPAAQRLFDRDDRLDAIYVDPAPGTGVGTLQTRLERVVGQQNGVLRATDGPPEVEAALGNVLPLFTLMALFAMGTGAALVYNTVALSLEERRRELAVVGALGGTASTVVRTVLGEAVVIGAVGGVLGAFGGLLVARPIVRTLSGFTIRTAGIPITVHVGLTPLVVSALLGVVMACVASAIPVRRALRIGTAAELSGRGARAEASAPRLVMRASAWGVVAGVGLVLVVLGRRHGGLERWQVTAGGLGFAATALGLLLFGASVAPLLLRPVGRLVEGTVLGRMAVANLVRAPGRTAVMVAAVTAATTTAFVIAGYSNGLRSAYTSDIQDNMHGFRLAATGTGANLNLDAGLPPSVIDAIGRVPGVASIDGGTAILTGARPSELLTVVGRDESWAREHDGERVVRGHIDAAGFARGEALIDTTVARDTGLRPGDRIALRTPGGMVDVPVQAVIAGNGNSGRSVRISMSLHRRLYGDLPVKAVTVEADPDVRPDELLERVVRSHALDDVDNAEMSLPNGVIADASGQVDSQLVPVRTFQRALLAVSFVAVLSTLLLVGVQRRRELAMLAAVGTEPSTLAGMVVTEAGLVAAVALVLSAAGGVVVLWALLEAAPLVIGFSAPFRPDWASLVGSGAVALIVALLASFWPARRAARTDVVVALRYE